jgi:hypothetical protein
MNVSRTAESIEIGVKSFTDDDQRLFAAISLDVNPLHMDPLVARRLLTGRQAVHGIHVLLVAIEFWRNARNDRPTSLSCNFNNLISVDDQVVFSQKMSDANRYIIEARVNGLLCIGINIGTAKMMVSETASGVSRLDEDVNFVDNLSSPLNAQPETHLGKTYAIDLRGEDYSSQFPGSYRYYGGSGFAAICSLSYIVGMVCPGLHSIFTSFDLQFPDPTRCNNVLRFRCEAYDDRFGLFDIRLRGCAEGHIRAFLRPSPPELPSVAELAKFVGPAEFEGTTTLIIGGSRGLGAVTAKILAAGGGDIVITYASGIEQALQISEEINNLRRSTCAIARFDVTTDSFESLNVDFASLHSVYYFPTPRIFTKKATVFDPQIFLELYLFYVRKFYDLCAYLEAVAEKPLQVFFPSSVAIEERPRDITEYAMAKAAAEVLVVDINKYFKLVCVSAARLPRLNTDQTATIYKNISTQSNVDVLLPIVRSLNARISRK